MARFFSTGWSPEAALLAVAVLFLVVFLPTTDFGRHKNSG